MTSTVTSTFKAMTSNLTHKSPHLINEGEANELIGLAHKVNHDNAHLCGAIKSHKGTRELKSLFNHHRDSFDGGATHTMKHWMKSHKAACCL